MKPDLLDYEINCSLMSGALLTLADSDGRFVSHLELVLVGLYWPIVIGFGPGRHRGLT